mgnify:CR=1 FL=1
MELKLKGQSVLITGSSRGIGRGIAEGFLKEKTRIILTGRDEGALNETATKFRDQYGTDKVLCFLGDIQLADTLKSLNEFIANRAGGLDHLVCNIGSGQSVPPLEEDLLEFQRMLDINLMNAVGVVKQMLSLLECSVEKRNASTSITFVGSICGMESLGCPIAYASAKSALISYSKNISKSLGKKGIRVNVVSPGNILFKGSTWEKKLMDDRDGVEAMLTEEVPLERFGDVCDVANAVLFLASKCASFITGANWVVDGGQTSTI